MFRNPTADLLVVLVIVLLFLGPKRLPTLGRSLGQGMREFKDAITGDSKHDADEDRPELTRPAPAPVPSASPSEPSASPSEPSAPEPQSADRS
jgi:sec-independent protein translocase protein TatA